MSYKCVSVLVLACVLVGCVRHEDGSRYMTEQDKSPRTAEWQNSCRTLNDLKKIIKGSGPSSKGGYLNPPLMALGDSLYNGTNSLRQNWSGAEHSVPVFVALRQRLIETDGKLWDRTGKREFYAPSYPRCENAATDLKCNYGLNLQNLLGASLSMSDVAEANTGLMKKARPVNNRLMADNLAIASARTENLFSAKDLKTANVKLQLIRADYGLTSRLAKEEFDSDRLSSPRNNPSVANLQKWLPDSFLLANSRFVLNPHDVDCLQDITPVGQVLLRQPKNLLVNIGSNNGLYWLATQSQSYTSPRKCESGKEVYPGDGCTVSAESDINEAVKQIKLLINVLNNGMREPRSGQEDQKIFINGLLKPRYTASINPKGLDFDHQAGYYKHYKISYPISKIDSEISGKELEKRDKAVENYNMELKREVDRINLQEGRQKFVYIDVNRILAELDCKNLSSEKQTTQPSCGMRLNLSKHDGGGSCYNYIYSDTHLTNDPVKICPSLNGLELCGVIGGPVLDGGMFSFDHMHPSIEGYALLAYCISKVIQYSDTENGADKGLASCIEGARDGNYGETIAKITKPEHLYCLKSEYEHDSNRNNELLTITGADAVKTAMRLGLSIIERIPEAKE